MKPAPHQAYRNLHTGLWSIVDRSTGRVVAHRQDAIFTDVQLVVQPAGNARARKEGRKNVHAFVRGTLMEPGGIPTYGEGWCRLRYNPYVEASFLVGYTPVTRARAVALDADGTAWALYPT